MEPDQDAATRALGRGMRALRIGRGLTVQALADAAGLSVQYVSMLERGRRSARLQTLSALSAALDVSPSELLAAGEAEEARPKTRLDPVFEGLTDAEADGLLEVLLKVRGLVRKAKRDE